MKILSPVGNFESLKMAIYNGADEVYLGVSDYNARNNIDGFSVDDLDRVVLFSHIFDVKVNLAVNILFSNDEIQDAVNLVVQAYNKGVDCFIIQDLGLASVLHKSYPQIELHASTQMGIHNLEGVLNIKKYGFKRVVLARETPLDEIKRIKKNVDIEIEYFCHGALCVCFSGNCYLSSYLFNASGNRGKCKQLCRLPYELQKDGKTLASGQLLSAKDFNMSQRLDELKNAGVDVLKIEGRARRPFYVAMATREYFNALHGEKVNQTNLKLAFNRGYTAGYFDGNGNIISKENSHVGIKIGKIIKVNYGKKFNEIVFTSTREISNKSSIKIFDNGKEESVISLYSLKKLGENKYLTTTTQSAKVGNDVNLIVDFDLENEMLSFVKKKEITISVKAFAGKQIEIQTNFFGLEIQTFGEELQKAKSQPLDKEEVQECFNKNEYFSAKIEFESDGVFIAKSKLNELRRSFYEKLENAIKEKNKHNLSFLTIKTQKNAKIFDNFQIIENIGQKLEAKNIIFSPETYLEKDILEMKKTCEKNDKEFYLDLPNFALKKDVELLRNIVEKNDINIVANNYYALDFNCHKIAGGGLNVYNNISASELGLPVICSEDSITSKTNFPYMTLRHCPFKCDIKASCEKCPYSKNYTLKMQNGKVLKIKRKKLSTCTFYLTD